MINSRMYCFPFKPVSVNEAYGKTRGRGGRAKFLTQVSREYKDNLKLYMEIQDNNFYEETKLSLDFQTKSWIVCDYLFLFSPSAFYMGDPPYEEGRKFYALDNSNFIKLIEDAFAEYTEIDDRYVSSLTAIKGLSTDISDELYDENLIIMNVRTSEKRISISEEYRNLAFSRVKSMVDLKKLYK